MAYRVSAVCLSEEGLYENSQADSHTIQKLTSGRCG